MPDEIRSGPGPKSNFLDDFSGMFRNKLAGPSYFDGAAELVNRLLAKPSASQNLAAWEYNRTPPMPNEGQQNMLGKLLSIVPENALLASNFIGPGARAAVPKLAVPKDVPLLFDSLSNGVIPDGWYVHGRAKGTELRSDAVIQATRNLDVADQYGRSGSKWALRPMDDARVLNLNDNDANIRKISQMMMADHRSGNLPYDIKEALGRSPPISTFYEFANEFAPPKIVTSAGAFDNPNWAQWLHDRTKADFVITPDGAVVLNKDAIEAHRYDHKIR